MIHDHPTAPDAMPVEALALDEMETGLLAVLRHFLTAFSRPETHAWQSAFTIAAERWGVARGPQIAQSLLAVLHAVRHSRQTDFRFTNPLCLHCRDTVTPEEAAFIRMIHAMRRDQNAEARGAVLDLAEGVMDPMLIQAGLAFAARFPAEGSDWISPTRRTRPSAGQQSADKARPQGRHLRLVH